MKEKLLRFLASDPLTNAWAKLPPWAHRFVVFPTFFLFCFFTFCYWTFPYERVRDFVVQSVEYEAVPGTDRLRPTRWKLSIIELEPSWVTGIDLIGVRVRREAEDANDRPLDLAIPAAHARVSIFSLLIGSPSVTFNAEVASGTVEGAVELEGDALRELELEVEDVNLRRLGAFATVLGLPLSG
ncbi:MAG: type II secretion system protein GspN, partial [Polyangiaceae bacterium]|nr:type II secretion system protein GspN [Polyangiaceae bacterium]